MNSINTRDASHVYTRDTSHVNAHDASHVYTRDTSHVRRPIA